jgi:hypothetical protein
MDRRGAESQAQGQRGGGSDFLHDAFLYGE